MERGRTNQHFARSRFPGSGLIVQDKRFPLRHLPFAILLAGIIKLLLRLSERGAEQYQVRGLMGLKEVRL
jgi:hypothetical protein